MSATSVVEKATSDMLIGPDWAVNLDLCDSINNDPSQAKDVVKAVKKRLTNRNPQVQLLALTVLETLIKNCGDNVHQQVAEKDVLHELVKIVKKKADMRVRDKTLVLLDSWQEAFGGSSGRYPQYFMAYNELQKLGVEFPRRGGEHSVPIFTPPQSQPIASPSPPAQFGHRPPRLPFPQPDPVENLPGMSLTDIQSSRGLVEVLSEMLSALSPQDRMAAKEEIIVELVDQCRTDQHRVLQLVNTTSDEELLRQGLSLNDELQRVLARHEAIISGTPLPEDSDRGHSHGHSYQSETEPKESDLITHRSQPRTEAQSSLQGATTGVPRPKSARTVFPQLAPPPLSGKKPVVGTSSVASAPRDATLDLLSGDISDSQPPASSAPLMQSLPTAEQQGPMDFLALPAPEGLLNPFESAPFQASPLSQALVPVTPPTAYLQQQAETQRQPPENTNVRMWSAQPPAASARQQASLYGEVQPQSPESVSGQPLQGQQQYYFAPVQPVVKTPPPWQEELQSQVEQQQQQQQAWQGGAFQASRPWGQNVGLGASNSRLTPGQQYFQPPAWAQGMNDASRFGSGGSGPGDNFGSQYLQQRAGSAYGQSSSSAPSSQQLGGAPKSVKPADMLFHDLVDLRSVNSKFKGASLVDKVSAPNTSKAGP